jgi:hypothetical protein
VTLSREDEEQLRILTIAHYVVAGMQALFGCFPVFHLVMGVWMLTSPAMEKAKDGPPEALFGALFIAFALLWMLTAWSLAGLLVVAARSLAQRRRRTLCLVAAGLEAVMCMPLGTVLGVFTIIVLMRPSVREAFEASTPVAAASPA